MTLAMEVAALRSSAGASRAEHIAIVRVEGADALELLQRASTQSPYAREGRVRHTLFLREDASVFADVLIVKVEDAFLVLAEGANEDAIVSWLEGIQEQKAVTIRGMKEVWGVLGVDGPYAWEVVAALLGPVTLGMPYLSLLHKDDVLCVRAGKTGEYGYLLMVPRASIDAVELRLLEVGAPLDLARVTLEALDVCALESWHFSMRTLPKGSALTPIELQLQWRVGYTREFVGAEALRALRAAGAKARITCFVSEHLLAPGQRVRIADVDAGEVLATCASPTLDRFVGSVLLERRFAHPHLDLFAGAFALRTYTASLVHNLSLQIQPHKHSYATRVTA